jgi:chloramphenicol O-acetyltransferase type A
MQIIDLSTWSRRQYFEVYQAFDYPHINLCAPVDVTPSCQYAKTNHLSITVLLNYIFARAANEISNFRYRIRGDQVVEHEVVHPSSTILTEGDLFSFCTIPFQPSFRLFSESAMKLIEQVKQNRVLEDEPGKDDLLYLSAIPWISFTSVSHPIHMHPVDSIPRITWGKFYHDGDRLLMPLSVQVHHALMDGYHIGVYFNLVQEYLSTPENYIEP